MEPMSNLLLSRKEGERIVIGDNIVVTVIDVGRGKVRLSITAPKSVSVDREEIRIRKGQPSTGAQG